MGGIVSFCDHEGLPKGGGGGKGKKKKGRDLDEFLDALSELSSSSSSSPLPQKSLFILWKFSCVKESSNVKSEAIDFGKASPEYDKTSAYVALHIFPLSPSLNESKKGNDAITAGVSPAFESLTPRGLEVPISFRTRSVSEVTHDTYVWNGKKSAQLVKATAVAKAYQLEKALREVNMTCLFHNIPRHMSENIQKMSLLLNSSNNSNDDDNNNNNGNHCVNHHFFRALLSYSSTGSFLTEGGLTDFSNLFVDNKTETKEREKGGGKREGKRKRANSKPKQIKPPTKTNMKLHLNSPVLHRGSGPPSSGRVPAPAPKLGLKLSKIEPKEVSPKKPTMVPSSSVECQKLLEDGTERPDEIPVSTRDRVRYFNRICSKVTDQLYLGSDYVAQNLALLQENNITHVLNCAGTVCNNYFPEHFTYKTLHLVDGKSEDVLCVFLEVMEFLHRAWCAKGKIFIHCQQGISRSSTMLICYVMQQEGKTFQAVAEEVKRKRDISSPNAGFMCQLTEWGKVLSTKPINRKPEMSVVLPHNLCAPDVFPLKAVPLNSKSLDSRCVCLLSSPETIYIWIGSAAHPASIENAKKGIKRMQEFLNAPEEVVEMQQGQETKGFCNILGAEHPIKEFANNQHYNIKLCLLPLFDAQAQPKPVERKENNQSPELWVFRSSWLHIKLPTDEERDQLLKDDVIFSVLVKNGLKVPHAYLWVGKTYQQIEDKEVNNLGLQFLTRNSIFMNFNDYKIVISRQGKEKEGFWKFFKGTSQN